MDGVMFSYYETNGQAGTALCGLPCGGAGGHGYWLGMDCCGSLARRAGLLGRPGASAGPGVGCACAIVHVHACTVAHAQASSSSGTMGPVSIVVHCSSCNQFPSSPILSQTVQLL